MAVSLVVRSIVDVLGLSVIFLLNDVFTPIFTSVR
jgi:hypothetical protein